MAPPQAADAVTAVLSGDVARMREAVAPPLDEHLLAPAPTGSTAPGSGDVRLSDWRQQEAFAGATAEVAGPGGPSRLLVGFMLVDGKWRITFVEPLP